MALAAGDCTEGLRRHVAQQALDTHGRGHTSGRVHDLADLDPVPDGRPKR